MDDWNGNSVVDEGGEAAELTVLSASSINTFLRCGQQWYYAYVLRLKRPPTLKQLLGIAGHEAIEANYRQKIETLMDMPEDEVLDVFSDAWDQKISDAKTEENENPGDFKDAGVDSVKLYRRKVAPTVMPQWVEEPVRFKINGIPYSGVIDLVDSLSRIRDHKFVGRRPTDGRSYILNMTGYALAYRHYTLQRETDIVLDHIVRGKKPDYVPIASNGPVPDSAIRSFAKVVENVSSQVEEGRFVPNGLVGTPPACSWCGYNDICPYYRRSQ